MLPFGLLTFIVIVPAFPESEQVISVLLTVKSGAGIASTLIEVSAEQLLESTTVILKTPVLVTGIIAVD